MPFCVCPPGLTRMCAGSTAQVAELPALSNEDKEAGVSILKPLHLYRVKERRGTVDRCASAVRVGVATAAASGAFGDRWCGRAGSLMGPRVEAR